MSPLAKVNKEVEEERSVQILAQLVEHKPCQGCNYHDDDQN